jgi:hypothetical protein
MSVVIEKSCICNIFMWRCQSTYILLQRHLRKVGWLGTGCLVARTNMLKPGHFFYRPTAFGGGNPLGREALAAFWL